MKKIKFYLKSLFYRFMDDDIIALGGQLAYSFLLSFFPFLIFLMTLLGFSSLESKDVLSSLKEILPLNAYELIYKTVLEVINTKNTHLMSFSLVFTIWSASSGFNAVIKGLNKAYDEKEKRSFFKVQLISILCTFALVCIIIFTMLLLVFGRMLGNSLLYFFHFNKNFIFFWNMTRYIIMLAVLIFAFASLYHFTPSRKINWTDVMPGALFCSVSWVIASLGFSYYVNNFGRYSRLYGSIGAVIILMTWLFISSVIILIGGEINAIAVLDDKDFNK